MHRSHVAFDPVISVANSSREGRSIWELHTVRLWLRGISIGPDIRQDYPLNLSILISGGKETNKDSPSNGE